MNTKRIAYLAGTSTAIVNQTARDLGLEMDYFPERRCWEVIDPRAAQMLQEHLAGN